MQPIIEVEHLTKRYRKTERNAVDDISFSVQEGAFFAFLGPNGAGKTTTISVLTTTLTLSHGSVRVAGYDVRRNAREVRQRIGVIFQTPSIDKNLTAEENIRFHASLYGIFPFRPLYSLMPRAYKDRVEELSTLVGIAKEMFQPIGTFSGGMKRKLEIIRGLMHHPKVLFLDEPTTGLDPVSRKNVWNYLRDVREKEHTTIFLTTHYLEEAEGADHICIINEGKIVSSGTPREIAGALIDEYLLIGASDQKTLGKELIGLGISFLDESPMRIPLGTGQSAHRILKSIKTPLTLIKIHTPSLEEAYLEIVDHSS